jgi:hypothetical protein
VDESNFYLNESSFYVGAGSVTAKGRLEDYLQKQDFRFNLEAKDIDLKEILDQKNQDIQLAGKVVGSLKLNGSGLSGDAVLQSVSGDGTLEMKEGKLAGINILKIVLDKISLIPDLVARVEANIPQKYKDSLKKNETNLDKVLLRLSMAQGVVNISPAQLEAEGFGVEAAGRVDLEQNLTLKAGLLVLKDLSESMIKSVSSLKNFADAQGRISIPLKEYRGPIASYWPFPDLEYLTKRFAVQEGRSELEKVLKKALGKNEEPAEGTSSQPASVETSGKTPDTQSAPQKNPKSPEDELINNVLDMIFK